MIRVEEEGWGGAGEGISGEERIEGRRKVERGRNKKQKKKNNNLKIA